MKTLIAVPCMNQVAAEFAQSIACLNKVGDCACAFQIGSLVYESRNSLAKKAIEIEADYVLWLDSDMKFAPDIMQRLMGDITEKGCDLVSGLYFRRVFPYTPVLFEELGDPEKDSNVHFKDYDEYPENSLFPIAGAGFGCLLHKADILLDSFAKYGTCFDPMDGYGEDLSFCIRAKNLGYNLFCDSTVKCGHVGSLTITEDFWKRCGGGK